MAVKIQVIKSEDSADYFLFPFQRRLIVRVYVVIINYYSSGDCN